MGTPADDPARASTELGPPNDDLCGTVLDHYRVVAKLGQGGMGVVYRARDERLGRDVALKVLPASLARDEERRRRLVREARSAAAVDHPNIATVFDVGEAHGRVYLAMELLSGTTLGARLAAGPLEKAEAIRVARAIAEGLARAHTKGVVHRDLKPDNVMLLEGGGVKILDFGLAKLRDQATSDSQIARQDTQTREGAVMGTPGYMSPEQATARPVDARTDVFAWGVVLHEMLTGELPGTYADKQPADANLAAIIRRCLARAPDGRFADAGEVLRALDARPRTVPPPPPSPPTRRFAPATLAAFIGAAGVAAVASVLVYRAATTKPQPLSASAAASASAPASASAVTLADLPLPASSVPEAVTEYRAGIQLLRDDSFSNARARFAHAIQLDPSMAAAYLRAAVIGISIGAPEDSRADLARAAELRSMLSERDRDLLEAVEPVVGRTIPDQAEALARLRAAHDRRPLDEELVFLQAELTLADPAQSIPLARAAIALDPQDAAARECLGRALALSGDLAAGREALSQCSAISVESSDCLYWLGLLDGAAARCGDMEADARREADIDPRWGNVNLSIAEVALDRPEGAVRETVGRYVAAGAPELRVVQQALFDFDSAVLQGRFDVARKALDTASAALDASSSNRVASSWRLSVATRRVDLLRETGDEAGARAAATDFTARATALTRQGSPTYFDAWWALARVAGEPLDPARATWVDGKLRGGAAGSAVWVAAWAAPATTADDARAALAAIDADPRLSLPRGGEAVWGQGNAEALAGRVLLLAQRPADAAPHLRNATADCFALRWPFEHVRAGLDLGRALEQSGDTAGACDAYGRVLARWGTAKPPSATATAARAASRALSCAR
jgi:serine/threonine-protein kinase